MPGQPCCLAATHMDVTGAKPYFGFKKRPRPIWRHSWKPAAPSHPPSETNSCSPHELWVNTPRSTAASWSVVSARSAANTCATPAVTGITPIPSGRTASSHSRGTRATSRAALWLISSKTSASRHLPRPILFREILTRQETNSTNAIRRKGTQRAQKKSLSASDWEKVSEGRKSSIREDGGRAAVRCPLVLPSHAVISARAKRRSIFLTCEETSGRKSPTTARRPDTVPHRAVRPHSPIDTPQLQSA